MSAAIFEINSILNNTNRIDMETKNTKEETKCNTTSGKKAKEGKLSKIGEWLLSGKGKELGWKVSQENMKYILK